MYPIFERKWEETFAASKFPSSMFYQAHNSHDNILRLVWRTMGVFKILECHGLKGTVCIDFWSMIMEKWGE
jgi:hypothetical protein